jgi:hypothetical protein
VRRLSKQVNVRYERDQELCREDPKLNVYLIKNPDEMSGTCYFEFLPGAYKGSCWNETSVFLSEDSYNLIEPAFEGRIVDYDHYSFMAVPRATWSDIINDLEALSEKLATSADLKEVESSCGFIGSDIEESLTTDFLKERTAIIQMIGDLKDWLKISLESHEIITVLGM